MPLCPDFCHCYFLTWVLKLKLRTSRLHSKYSIDCAISIVWLWRFETKSHQLRYLPSRVKGPLRWSHGSCSLLWVAVCGSTVVALLHPEQGSLWVPLLDDLVLGSVISVLAWRCLTNSALGFKWHLLPLSFPLCFPCDLPMGLADTFWPSFRWPFP